MSTKTLLTLADFEQLPEHDSVRYELDEGELVATTFSCPNTVA
jgi:Uma2 family endonuclease